MPRPRRNTIGLTSGSAGELVCLFGRAAKLGLIFKQSGKGQIRTSCNHGCHGDKLSAAGLRWVYYQRNSQTFPKRHANQKLGVTCYSRWIIMLHFRVSRHHHPECGHEHHAECQKRNQNLVNKTKQVSDNKEGNRRYQSIRL